MQQRRRYGIDTSRFTDRALQVLELAEEQARLVGSETVEPEHLAIGILRGGGVASHVLQALGVTSERVLADLQASTVGYPAIEGMVRWAHSTKQIVKRSTEELSPLGHNYVGTEHLLLGFASSSEVAIRKLLVQFSLTPQTIKREVYNLLGHSAE